MNELILVHCSKSAFQNFFLLTNKGFKEHYLFKDIDFLFFFDELLYIGNLKSTESSCKCFSSEGIYQNGKKEGYWIFQRKSGQITEKGFYLNGKREGHWDFCRMNGQPFEKGTYTLGKKEGYWIQYYKDNSKLAEGIYRNGEKEGSWIWTTKYEKKESVYMRGHIIAEN